jgi:hypothetical protein
MWFEDIIITYSTTSGRRKKRERAVFLPAPPKTRKKTMISIGKKHADESKKKKYTSETSQTEKKGPRILERIRARR